MLRNQKDAFYFDDYVVAIMVGMGLFILPFLGEFAISTFWLETLWLIIMSRNPHKTFSGNNTFCDTKMFKIRKRTKFLCDSSNNRKWWWCWQCLIFKPDNWTGSTRGYKCGRWCISNKNTLWRRNHNPWTVQVEYPHLIYTIYFLTTHERANIFHCHKPHDKKF